MDPPDLDLWERRLRMRHSDDPDAEEWVSDNADELVEWIRELERKLAELGQPVSRAE